MRIATSTMFERQTNAIDNLSAQYSQYGNELTTGKRLNRPSDDPTVIGEDLAVRTTVAQENQAGNDLSEASARLTTVDGALSSLTALLQQARQLAVQGASDVLSQTQRDALAHTVDGLLQQAIGLANTRYANTYVFAGDAQLSSPPVSGSGSPVSAVSFSGNFANETQLLPDGQRVPTAVSMQQAFNLHAPDGSPSVFEMLMTLRDTLSNSGVDDVSAAQLNLPGTSLTGATALNSANFATALVPDSSGTISISIASSSSPSGMTLIFPATDTVANVVAAINGSGTGVTASFDPRRERFSLSAKGPFTISDVPSPGPPPASGAANFTAAFKLQTQADTVNTLSGQLGTIDGVTQAVLAGRAQVGATLQNVASLASTYAAQATANTQVESGFEDADIATVTTQFAQTQTALQAAYATTSRLEGKTLFDYLQ